MVDNLIKQNENDFIKENVSDKLYRTILREIRAANGAEDPKNRGRKIELTAEKLHNFLFYLSMGVEYKEAAESAFIPESTRQKYSRASETFRRVSERAKGNLSLRSRLAIGRAIMGTKPGYIKLDHPVNKTTEYILVKGIEPNVQLAQWWLETVDKIGGADKDAGQPTLGAPRNEEEAKLLEMLLNKHYDYVKSKERPASK